MAPRVTCRVSSFNYPLLRLLAGGRSLCSKKITFILPHFCCFEGFSVMPSAFQASKQEAGGEGRRSMHSDCKVFIYNSRDLMALCKNNDIQIFSVSDWWLKWADEGKMWKLLLAQFLLCSSVRSLELKSRTSSKKTMYVSFIAKNPPVSHENLLVYL